DRDIPGPSGDEVARRIVASGEGPAILMLTAADRLHDKETGFELGADDYLTKPFAMRELVLRIAPSPDAETDGDRRSSKPQDCAWIASVARSTVTAATSPSPASSSPSSKCSSTPPEA